ASWCPAARATRSARTSCVTSCPYVRATTSTEVRPCVHGIRGIRLRRGATPGGADAGLATPLRGSSTSGSPLHPDRVDHLHARGDEGGHEPRERTDHGRGDEADDGRLPGERRDVLRALQQVLAHDVE